MEERGGQYIGGGRRETPFSSFLCAINLYWARIILPNSSLVAMPTLLRQATHALSASKTTPSFNESQSGPSLAISSRCAQKNRLHIFSASLSSSFPFYGIWIYGII